MMTAEPARTPTCFFEHDPRTALLRRMMVEGVGTLLLMFVATGAGLTAEHADPASHLLDLMVIAIAVSGALVGLIYAFGAVSGGHFNPLITGLQWAVGERPFDCMIGYVVAQLAGGALGASLARLMFAASDPSLPTGPASSTLAASEVFASAALMSIVFACARSGRAETGPVAVGAWLAAAIIATPSTSYANPAISIGAIFAAGPLMLPPATALIYVVAECCGALLALAIITIAYPARSDAIAPSEA